MYPIPGRDNPTTSVVGRGKLLLAFQEPVVPSYSHMSPRSSSPFDPVPAYALSPSTNEAISLRPTPGKSGSLFHCVLISMRLYNVTG